MAGFKCKSEYQKGNLSHDLLGSFEPGEVLWVKQSRSTKAGVWSAGGDDCPAVKYFIKEYRYDSFWHKLVRRVRSKGRKVWGVMLELESEGVSLPSPMALFIHKQPGFLCEYVVTEYLEGAVDLRSLDLQSIPGECSVTYDVISQAALLIAKTHFNGVVHGDYKWGNLMYVEANKSLHVVDFDGCFRSVNDKCFAEDLARFLVNMYEAGMGSAAQNLFLKTYAEEMKKNVEVISRQVKPCMNKILRRHLSQYPNRFEFGE